MGKKEAEAAKSGNLREALRKLIRIGAALSEERDLARLLDLILTSARDLVGCDAGSVYLVEDAGVSAEKTAEKHLYFLLAQNDSAEFTMQKTRVEITRESIAGYVALTGETLNIADVREIPKSAPYQFNFSFDDSTGYRTVSMLAVPMRNQRGELLGVIQLINRRREFSRALGKGFGSERVLPFDEESLELALSLASQAGVAIENNRLYREIRELFDAFVHASVAAIESRDPTTSGHSARVGRLTTELAKVVDAERTGPFRDLRFSADDLRQIEYASVLHDFGKIGVREEVLVKAKKLYPHELTQIEARARQVALHMKLNTERNKVECLGVGGAPVESIVGIESRLSESLRRLDSDVEAIRQANNPTVLDDGSFEGIRALARQPLEVPGCDILTLLDRQEAERLGIRRGSLSEEERREIEAHVTHTYRYLKRIPWPRELSRVPDIAYAHHEKMDGSGYPRGLKGTGIPVESRMMTIADIYDALTAWDRPYKKAIPEERALAILESEAVHGAIDGELLKIFIASKVYQMVRRDRIESVRRA